MKFVLIRKDVYFSDFPHAPVMPPVSFVPAPEPAPLWPPCDGVDLIYITTFTEKIYPYLNDTRWLQPYKFTAEVVITNMRYSTVDAWAMGINCKHGEVCIMNLE